jgi:hypothetical protein
MIILINHYIQLKDLPETSQLILGMYQRAYVLFLRSKENVSIIFKNLINQNINLKKQ